MTMKHWVQSGVIAAGAVLAIYGIVVLSQPAPAGPDLAPSRQVRLKGPLQPADSGAGAPAVDDSLFRVAVAPVISSEQSIQRYKPFIQCLGTALDARAVLVQRTGYAELNKMIRHGQCEIAFVCTYPFIQAERDFGLQALVVPQIGGRITYRSFILVQPGNGAKSLLDLAGTKFASADILSNSGWLYPATWLMKEGKEPERFFAEHVITGSHDRSVLAVSSGYVDAAAVDSLVYEQMVRENPDLLSKTRIVMKSPDFGMPPLVASPSLSPDLRSKIRDALVHLHETEKGRKALGEIGIERFVVPPGRLFDSVREAALLWEARKGLRSESRS